jgi:hypothetical protein
VVKMEAICSSETSVETQQTTRLHIPKDDTLHSHGCENLKSCTTTRVCSCGENGENKDNTDGIGIKIYRKEIYGTEWDKI